MNANRIDSLTIGANSGGQARVVRTDDYGRLEIVLAGGVGAFQRQVVFTVEGTVAAAAGSLRIPNATAGGLLITGVRLDAGTAPTGAGLVVDVHKSGVTIFTTQANRPSIAASAYSGVSGVPDVQAWAAGEYLTVDVDQVGSTVPGSNLTVTILVV